MNPIAIDLGFVTIRWYGIMVALTFALGVLISRALAKNYGLDLDKFDWLPLILAPVWIIGARASYVIANYSYYRNNPWEIIRVDYGGLGSQGALILTFLAGLAYAQITKMSFWTLADTFGPVLALGHVLVRIGNFANGELYGSPTSLPWGVIFPGTLEPRHPSMLYEGFAAAILFVLAFRWARSRKYPGEVFVKGVLGISVIRFFVDFTRDSAGRPHVLALTQVLAFVYAVLSVIALRVLASRAVTQTSGEGKTTDSGNLK